MAALPQYFRPTSLPEALTIAASGARVAAGCTDLFPATTRQSLAGDILDVTAISGLDQIEMTESGLRIGATATWSEVANAALPPACQGLQAAACEVGSIQIQNAATIGGNLCNASPAADGVPPLLTLDADVELQSADGGRSMPLDSFLTGPRETALRPGEILTAVVLPHAALAGESAFLKLGARKHLVISIVMAAARIVVEDGAIRQAAIAIGACSPTARRVPAAEASLIGATDARALDLAAIRAALAPIDDIRADAGYRIDAAATLAKRAVADVLARHRAAA